MRSPEAGAGANALGEAPLMLRDPFFWLVFLGGTSLFSGTGLLICWWRMRPARSPTVATPLQLTRSVHGPTCSNDDDLTPTKP
jgi:hypothetical protein